MSKETLIEKWTEENQPLGKLLGYPDCCITAFCNQPPQLMIGKSTSDDYKRYKAGCLNGEFTGFIPCISHANQIKQRKITLASLIKDRNEDFAPFPHEFKKAQPL